ncbi:hypothetical protein PPERSA_00152 [Pseudocohnilembus persalinus]|uniref:Uncharacterized protein n=1 Tax=Pseudocohnilembus persalinus TaxID=266149 RepID=A0A0V0QHM3_PSEPJ|nr:hypothetical protein PPERSA_00152 [Pseudocohnilembus persalinus]|eukprot:KRX01779.1 hypothetical protein PPERSA_00152 [Pseudocohnilembus persalinus]
MYQFQNQDSLQLNQNLKQSKNKQYGWSFQQTTSQNFDKNLRNNNISQGNQSGYKFFYSQNDYKEKINSIENKLKGKENEPIKIRGNFLEEQRQNSQILSFQEKKYLNNQDRKFDSSLDDFNFKKYMEFRYNMEDEYFNRNYAEKTMNFNYTRHSVLKDPIRQKSMRFSYVQPDYYGKNFKGKIQFKSDIQDFKNYKYEEIKPDLVYTDQRMKSEFEELDYFFTILKELVWSEIQMEEERRQIGQQMDFSVRKLYRLYFQPFLDKIRREEMRTGFHNLDINLSDEDISLLVTRFCKEDQKEKLIQQREMEYEEFESMFVSKLTVFAYDHIKEEKNEVREISDRSIFKVARYIRNLVKQEQQLESYRKEMQQREVRLERIYFGLCKYREQDLSNYDLYYYYKRNCMQVSFDQFNMFFQRIESKPSVTCKEKFVEFFLPKLLQI